MLDDAGYPKAPANRRATPTGKPAADAAPAAPAAGDASQTVSAPANYPKQQ
jgi:hypothetical protein